VTASAGVLYLPETKTSAGDFAFGLTAAWVGGCAQAWGQRRVSIAACAEVLGGAIHAVVYDLVPLHPGDRFWAGASVVAQARWRIVGPLVAELGAQAIVPITRPPYGIAGGGGIVFQEAPVAGAAFAGLGVSIP
jgi:hypothetical protein